MTDVEFTRLLSTLTETAAELNQESDSINHLIEQLEDKLSELNIGIEVWLERPTLDVEEDEEHTGNEDDYGNPIMRAIRTSTQLGYLRLSDTWHLAIRDALYRYDDNDHRWDFASSTSPSRLLDAPRNLRISALAAFPALLEELQRAAAAAVTAIRNAKKFVKK